MKKKLSSEGLFDQNKKKSIPKVPKRIGIVTASTGAAIRDILTTIKRRYPICETILFPSLVQGADAAADIVKKIEIANTYDINADVIQEKNLTHALNKIIRRFKPAKADDNSSKAADEICAKLINCQKTSI